MKQMLKLFTLLSLASMVLLAACGPTPPETNNAEETDEVATGDEITLFVGPELAECTGAGPQMCMMVKENREDEYTYFYNQIDGFEYEEGYAYELRVLVTPVENPPADGSSLNYSLVEVVEKTEATPAGEEITLYVGSELAECTGEAPQLCMMVKENPADDYTYFYDQIDGFEYEEGYEYELRVLVTPVENPPADGSSLHYSLVEVVNKTAVSTETTSIDGTTWQLDSYAVDGAMVETLPSTTFTFADGQMIGMTGCNNTGAEYTADGNAITFAMGASTMMFCGDAENAQEDAIRTNLDTVATYEMDDGSMQMMDADGNVILQFSAIDMDEMSASDATLDGTTWQLDSYAVDGAMVETLPSTTFTFADGQMIGMTGCNNTGAEYTADGNAITFAMGASTMMFCGDAENAQEDAIQANIATVASYHIDGNMMEMMDADGNVVLKLSTLEPIVLNDTLWQATGINNGTGGVTPLLAETVVTAVFAADGTLSGNASCNMYNTTYEAGDETLNIDPSIITTRRACTEPIAEQEGQYLTALANATTYSIMGDKLELRDADGSLQVSYVAVPPTPLVGTTWEATGINSGNQAVVSVMSGSRITAVFNEDNTLNGNAGCNSYFGSYTVTYTDGLLINEIGSTMMACADSDVMAQEAAYLTALETADYYTISDNTLELRTADGALAVSYVAAEPIPLADSEWEVVSHNNGNGGVTSSIIGTKMTMNFDADDGVTGSAGCNNYFGSYEAGGELLAFGPIASTEMFCAEPEGIMEQEAEFLAALATVNSYSIDGSHMNMRDENGSTAVDLQVKGYIEPELLSILENATYSSEFTEQETVTLTDGQYQTATVPSSASMTTVIMVDAAVGTIDGDYSAAVVLATHTGGTGTFISLHIMQFDNGEAVEIATTQLGDRTQINSVEINVNGEIVIDMVRHGADDPMCCPNEHAIVTYALEDGELVETAVEIIPSEE